MLRILAIGTALASALVLAGTAVAKGSPEIVTFPFELEDTNACTGERHTVFLLFTIRVHEFTNASGRYHLNAQVIVDVQTSDGFSGRIVGPDVVNVSADGDHVVFASMAHGVIANRETGQAFFNSLNSHVTVVNGTPVVDTFSEFRRCIRR